MFGGTAHTELSITLDGIKVPMGHMDRKSACELGLLVCGATREGWPTVGGKPASTAKVMLEKATGRLLAVDFTEKWTGAQDEAIQDAAVLGRVAQARELLSAHPSLVSSRDLAGCMPLIEAASIGNKEIAELLLASRADVNARDNLRTMMVLLNPVKAERRPKVPSDAAGWRIPAGYSSHIS